MPDVLGGASAAVGLLGAAYAAIRLLFDPKFEIVILDAGNPLADGRIVRSEVDEIRLKRGLPRIPLATAESRIPRQKPDRIRVVRPGRNKIRFILQNIGQRPSGKTRVVMRASSDAVRIVGFSSEGFELDAYTGFGTADPNSPIPLTNASDDLLQMWRDLGLTGDYLAVVGECAGGSFDACVLDLDIPDGVPEFALVFRLECEKSMKFKEVLYQWYRGEAAGSG